MTDDPQQKDLFAESTMTFGEHLDELRVVLFRSLVGLVIGFLIGLLVANHVVHWIQGPLRTALDSHYEVLAEDELKALYGENVPDKLKTFMKEEHLLFDEIYVERNEIRRIASATDDSPAEDVPPGEGSDQAEDAPPNLDKLTIPPPTSDMIKMRVWRRADTVVQSLSAQEPFMVWLKVGFVSGILIASPYIFFQIWSFVAAALYPQERHYVHLFLPLRLALFWAGAGLAFFFAFQHVLGFLFTFNRALNIQSEPRISEWIGFVLFLPLGFGVAFQLPLVMFFLNRIGIFSVRIYLEKWRIAILVIFILSMILTPADPISMLLMAAPLSGLYFIGIAMAQWMPRRRSPFSDAYEP